MALLEWRDSFSVGVAALDADHRQLIQLINELYQARQEDRDARAVRSIIGRLQVHMRDHFAREEAVMEKIGYDGLIEHRQHHQQTVLRIDQFSDSADDLPLQVLEFMKAWFINHVVCGDIKLREPFIAAGVADVFVTAVDISAKGILQKIGRRLDFLSLGWRIALLAFIPLAAFLVGAVITATERFQAANAFVEMEAVAGLGTDIGALVHELQKERGMSSLYLGSKGTRFAAELEAQRKTSDAKAARLAEVAAGVAGQLEGSEAAARLLKAKEGLGRIASMRDGITAQSVSPPEAIGFYSTTIASLLAVLEGMERQSVNADLLRDIAVYLDVMELKERAGQERATGAAGFAAGRFSADLLQRFLDLGAAQRTYERVTLSLADGAMIDRYKTTMRGVIEDDVARLRKVAFDAFATGQAPGLDPAEWFKAATARIDQLKTIEDAAAQNLIARAGQLHAAARLSTQAITAIIAIVLASVVTLALVLVASVVPPLAAFTRTMGSLAEGNHGVDTPCMGLRDELGQMATALQYFKEQLIASDLSTAQGWVESVEQSRKLKGKEALIGAFDSEMSGFLDRLGAAADELHSLATVMSGAANDTSERATAVASATEEASASVQTVASAAEELSSSITEIGRQVHHSKAITEGATVEAKRAAAVVGDLAESAQRIGAVVQLINDIASQTNLLALNATMSCSIKQRQFA